MSYPLREVSSQGQSVTSIIVINCKSDIIFTITKAYQNEGDGRVQLHPPRFGCTYEVILDCTQVVHCLNFMQLVELYVAALERDPIEGAPLAAEYREGMLQLASLEGITEDRFDELCDIMKNI